MIILQLAGVSAEPSLRNLSEALYKRLNDAATLRCSDGLADEFGVVDDQVERRRLYAYWALPKGGAADVTEPVPTLPIADPDSLEERAKRFAQVEVRTQQGAFRKAIFLAREGRCFISGCSIPEALEAAHLE